MYENLEKSEKFDIIIGLNRIWWYLKQKKEAFTMNFFETMCPKNMKETITKRGLPVLLKYAFINCFEDSSRRDFNFSSWSMKVHQKSNKSEFL